MLPIKLWEYAVTGSIPPTPCKLSFFKILQSKEIKVFVTLLEQPFQLVVSLVTSSSPTIVHVGPGKTSTGCYENKNRGV